MIEVNVIALKRKIRRLESDVKQLKETLKEAEIELLAHWSENGISKTTIDGTTLYVSRKLWAGGDTPELVKALEAEGLGDLVKPGVNRMTLTAYIKEVTGATPTMSTEEIHAALPPKLQEAIEITEKITFNMRNTA